MTYSPTLDRYMGLVTKALDDLGNPKFIDRDSLYDHIFPPTVINHGGQPPRKQGTRGLITEAMKRNPKYQLWGNKKNPKFMRVTP